MNVQEFLSDKHVGYEAIVHRNIYDAQRLAQELHTPGREVAKTVLLRADSGYAYIVAVLPATTVEGAMDSAERVRAAVQKHVLIAGGGFKTGLATAFPVGEAVAALIPGELATLPESFSVAAHMAHARPA